jgi:hypothetical protein
MPPPSAAHSGQSSNTPPPPSVQGYWSLSWAPPTGGQALPWGMPPWKTLTPQQPSSLLLTVRYLCLLWIVTFVIRGNVEHLANSSNYVFKQPSSSTGRDFIDAVLNMGGSDEGDGGGTSNETAPWSSCDMWCIHDVKWLCIVLNTMNCHWFMYLETWIAMYCCHSSICDMFLRLPIRGGSQNRDYIKNIIYSLVNRGTYDLMLLN